MLEWDGNCLTVHDRVFTTVDPALFLAGLREDPASPRRRIIEAPIEPPAPGDEPRAMFVWKSRRMIEQLAAIVETLQPKCIVELGIARGGSVALLGALAPDAKVVAIEIEPEPSHELLDHIERWGLGDHVRPYFGVDQSDRAALSKIIADEFGHAAIDLVIDDASHRLDASRASLEVLFPRVRPNGCYIIEDWAWAHVDLSEVFAEYPIPDGPPLTLLICELLMSLGTGVGVVDRLEAGDTVRVWRGPAQLDPDTWSLTDSYFTSAPVLTEG